MEVVRVLVVENPVFIYEQWFSGATTPAPTTIRKYSVCVWNCFEAHVSAIHCTVECCDKRAGGNS